MTQAAEADTSFKPGTEPVWGWKERVTSSQTTGWRSSSCRFRVPVEGARSAGQVSGPALSPPRCAIPAAGVGHSALCLRGPDLRGSLGPDTRHNLRRPRPAPDKELQLPAGESGGRWEHGWPSPRRGANKGARPPRRSAPPPPQAPQRLGQGLGPSAGAAPTPICRHVCPRGAGVGTWGLRAPGAQERQSEQSNGGLSCCPLLYRGRQLPQPRSPKSESLPGATSAHSPCGRSGFGALCRRSLLVLRPETEPKPGSMDAGGGARAPASLRPSRWPLSRRTVPSRSLGRGRAEHACPLRRLGALGASGSRCAQGSRVPSGTARGPEAAAAAAGALLAGAQAAARERGGAGRGRGAGRPD